MLRLATGTFFECQIYGTQNKKSNFPYKQEVNILMLQVVEKKAEVRRICAIFDLQGFEAEILVRNIHRFGS